jgi:ATP-dependent Lon protease
LITLRRQLGAPTPEGFTQFLRSIDDLEAFVDLAAFTLCPSPALKQRLLETLAVEQRLQLYGDALRQEIDKLTLQKKLQGGLADDDIDRN